MTAKKHARKPATRSAGEIDQILGERVRLARIENHVSQGELGDKLGVSFQQVQKYEKGANHISGPRLLQIAKALDVDISYFFDGLDNRRSNGATEFHSFIGTKFGAQIIEAMVKLTPQHQQTVIEIARSLARGTTG